MHKLFLIVIFQQDVSTILEQNLTSKHKNTFKNLMDKFKNIFHLTKIAFNLDFQMLIMINILKMFKDLKVFKNMRLMWLVLYLFAEHFQHIIHFYSKIKIKMDFKTQQNSYRLEYLMN